MAFYCLARNSGYIVMIDSLTFMSGSLVEFTMREYFRIRACTREGKAILFSRHERTDYGTDVPLVILGDPA